MAPSHLAETPSSSSLDLFPASQTGNNVTIVPTVPCGLVLLSINIFLLVQAYESWDCLVRFKGIRAKHVDRGDVCWEADIPWRSPL